MPTLTATTILGGTIEAREMMGQLLATQIGSALAGKNPEEGRLLVVGLGIQKEKIDREEFVSLVELALSVLL
jgi:proteasome assembly chaperone 3